MTAGDKWARLPGIVHDGSALRSALDAVTASWTIGSKEEGPALYLAAACLSHLD